MAIDRPLATPESIFSAGQGDEPDLEIEIVNPDSVSIETEDGGNGADGCRNARLESGRIY